MAHAGLLVKALLWGTVQEAQGRWGVGSKAAHCFAGQVGRRLPQLCVCSCCSGSRAGAQGTGRQWRCPRGWAV